MGWRTGLDRTTTKLLGSIVKTSRPPRLVELGETDPNSFVISFCGTGTGHFTQALACIGMLQSHGLVLSGVITDTTASQKILDEMIAPLGVKTLVLPTVEIIDDKRGMAPAHKILAAATRLDRMIDQTAEETRQFFHTAKPALLLNFYQVSLARFLQFNPLPTSVRVFHMAPQFGLTGLPLHEMHSPIEVINRAFMGVMRQVFAASAPCLAISANDDDGALAPIIELPSRLPRGGTSAGAGDGRGEADGTKVVEAPPPPLLLCYFLVQRDGARLERLLAKRPLPEGVEVHCFTKEALPQPKSGRPLSLHSHAKQRKLFQQLFARCTGVICSSGNETIWEAVCRGVPVLTIPSKGNGEQMLNAVVHATNHPLLVRHRPKLRNDDVRWLATFAQTEATRQESEALRSRVSTLMDGGPGALESHLSKVGVARQPTPVQDL